MGYQTYVKSQFSAKTIAEILTSPPSVLLGVSAAAQTELARLAIKTVFDLSVSIVFDNAARIVASSDNPRSVMRRYGRAPSSLVDAATLETKTPELPLDGIEVLVGVGPATGASLGPVLAVTTIRDLAFWPPFLAAKAIMLEAFNPPVGRDLDPEAPAELVPKSGEFGTERHQYSSVVMFPGSFAAPPKSMNGVLFDVTATPETGFDTVRYGARLTYAHSWNPVAVAKGHLLHSLPLAPGESANVAVIDWTNKSSASTQQSLTESERLASSNDRARTVSQIANSVANEFTSGASVTTTQSTSAEAGVGGIAGFFVGSLSGAANEQGAATHTVSTGDRNIVTNLQQNIRDATHQVSSSLRSERAASVSEINQAQSENLSTRSVTNYNHMHALTVQYYEVVQVYETETRLDSAERCIFLPMRRIDFSDERNIVKYLSILKAAALDGTTRSLLAEIEEHTAAGFGLTFAAGQRLPPVSSILPFLPPLAAFFAPGLQTNARALARDGFIVFNGDLDRLTLDYQLQLNNVRWSPIRAASPVTPITQVDIHLENGATISLPQTAATNADPSSVNGLLNGGNPLSFGRIVAISAQIDAAYVPGPYPPFPLPYPANKDEHLISLELAVKLGNDARWLDCSFLFSSSITASNNTTVYTIATPPGLAALGDLLNENGLYYSQQVWLREDPQSRIMQLAPFQIAASGGRINLVDYLSPQPLQVIGNYLVYRFTFEDDEQWQTWVTEHVTPSRASVDLVSVPTGGVFAEAVLGRANAAEKLDITRFFDWADSPPPAPPGIKPLAIGTHTPADAPPVGEFARPTVSIQAPLALPDPVGLSALLTAITTSDAFRNMSGLASSGDAANQALDASSKTAIGALQAAGTALATTLSALADALSKPKAADMSDTGSLVNQKAAAAKAEADKTDPAAKAAPPSAADSAKAAIVDQALSDRGIKTATTPPATPPPAGPPSTTDPALLDSRLVNEPTFSDVRGFVHLLELVADADLISVVTRRFSTLATTVDPLQKYAELVDVITTNSTELVNPARFLYAAKFVKTGVLPDDGTFDQADVAGVRSSALALAVNRALPIAHTINSGDTATTALTAILGACAAHGVADVDAVSYVLATAHHESAMGKYTTEIANGISSDTVFTRDAYFFNAIPGKKVSYNTLAGNTKAGSALQDRGVINGTPTIALWNGTVYPDAQPTAVKIAARTCDFMVFIGRGYVQLTGRRNYHQFSNLPALGNVNFEANPERVAEPAFAAAIMVLGMKAGSFRGGNKLSDYDLPTGWDATNARDIVNGDKATYGAAIRDIAKRYKSKLVQFAKLDETKPFI